MHKTLLEALLAAAIVLAVCAGSLAAAPADSKEPLDAQTLDTIRSDFRKLMELANRHDFQALHEMFWQSPSTLLVAKNAIPSEGNWAGFWGNEAIDQKLHDIGTSGPVVLGTRRQGVDNTRCLRGARPSCNRKTFASANAPRIALERKLPFEVSEVVDMELHFPDGKSSSEITLFSRHASWDRSVSSNLGIVRDQRPDGL